MRAGRPLTTLASGAAVLLLLAGCGGDGSADDADGSDAGGMDMSDVTSMNDDSATPASEVDGAAEGDFAVLDSAPPGSDGVAGEAWLAQDAGTGTTVTVELTGLEPGATYMAHLHAEQCGTDDGGPHFQFEEGGAEVPPNEVHLGLEADDEGNATATATNAQEVGDGAPSVVVHPTDLPDNRLACADF